MKSFMLVLVSSLLLSLIASQVNAQYFSASDGATVGRIGRETALSNRQQAKSSPKSSDTLKKLLSGRYSSHVKRMNDLGMLNFDDEQLLNSQFQSSESSSSEQNRRDEINQLREYLLRHLLNDYLNN